MKVTRNLDDQLIVEDLPWATGLAISAMIIFFTAGGIFSVLDGQLGGSIFFVGTALGGLAFWAFVRRAMVIFDRHRGTIEIRRKWIGGGSVEALALADLQMADVEFRETRKNGKLRRMTRPTLVMRSGHVPQKLALVEHFTGRKRADRIANAINNWLHPG